MDIVNLVAKVILWLAIGLLALYLTGAFGSPI